jgi:hypothetical protein
MKPKAQTKIGRAVVARLDREVDAFVRRTRFFHEKLTRAARIGSCSSTARTRVSATRC